MSGRVPPGPANSSQGQNAIGSLVGRPDLSDETLRIAIAERLAADGRSGPDPDIVLEAVRLRKRKAVAFLRKLVLPPPQAPLTMPVRPILRSQIAREGSRGGEASPHS